MRQGDQNGLEIMAENTMLRWMCGVTLRDGVRSVCNVDGPFGNCVRGRGVEL